MNVASSSRSTSGWVLVSRSASTCGQSISWAVVIACFLCSSDFGRSLEESRDDLHLSGYDTPDLTNGSDSYTTLVDATAVCVTHLDSALSQLSPDGAVVDVKVFTDPS